MAFKTMIGKALFITLFVSLFAANSIMAFQFEDFIWGKSPEDIMAVLKKGKKHILPGHTKSELAYTDRIRGQVCTITLFFTPKSYMLYMVKLRWETPSIGEELKEALIQRHGVPVQNEKSVSQYAWFGDSEEDMLALDYSGEITELFYSAGETSIISDSGVDEKKEAGDRF